MTYDLIIIGGGPAGAAAAVYASRKRLKTLLIVAEWGGQSISSEPIYNWIGTPAIAGNDLAENLKKHVVANAMGAATPDSTLEIKDGYKATKVDKADGGFGVTIESGETFSTKTVLIAAGSGRRKLE